MAVIEWSDSMSVKIPSIDEQHKKLVKMVCDLSEAVEGGNSKKMLGRVLGGLAHYTIQHFAFEEQLFEEFQYTEKDAHQKEHKALLQKVNTLIQKHTQEENYVLGEEVITFLKEWLTLHIMGSDMKYSEFLVAQGAS